jgi:hypothetical protein
MIYWFTGINYYKLAVEKDRDSIFNDHCDHMETYSQLRFQFVKFVTKSCCE